VNFFQRHPAKPADEIEPPVEPSLLPKVQETKMADMVIPIQVSDTEYALLMRALCPTGTHAPEDLPADVPEPNARCAVDRAGQPPPANFRVVSPDRPPGTPIV
jgi:hypothetical protein